MLCHIAVQHVDAAFGLAQPLPQDWGHLWVVTWRLGANCLVLQVPACMLDLFQTSQPLC